MTFINKEKFLDGVEKAVDGANNAAEHVDQFVKDKKIDEKIHSAMNKTSDFMKEKGIEQKFNSAVDKTEQFIKDNEFDKKAQHAVNSVGHGIKSAGEKMEQAFSKKNDDKF